MRFDGSISCCLKVEMLGLKSDMALSHRSLFRDLVVQSLPSAIGPNIQYNPPNFFEQLMTWLWSMSTESNKSLIKSSSATFRPPCPPQSQRFFYHSPPEPPEHVLFLSARSGQNPQMQWIQMAENFNILRPKKVERWDARRFIGSCSA